jgi:hypothetical protein
MVFHIYVFWDHEWTVSTGISSRVGGLTLGMILAYYPLVNVYITMENHHFSWEKITISMVMFHSFVNVYQRVPSGELT